MHTFYHAGHTRHDPAQLHRPDTPYTNIYYSEVARRGTIIYEALKAADFGPITLPGDFGIDAISEVHDHEMITVLRTAYERMLREVGRQPAIPETFSVGHIPGHKLQSISGLLGYYCFDTSSPIFEHTWDVVYWSAQTALSAAALVLAGGEKVAYALCRPPGHHAAGNLFGGFCYLNNAAIVANWLVQHGQRVAILDIDYHHGNGTQAIFYGRSDVLVCSIHADPLQEYPFYWGFADEYGAGAGRNHNFNFPLPVGTQESAYMAAYDEALSKIRLFVPDIVLISLGIDTAEGDPVGGFKLTTATFSRLGAKIAAFDRPAIVVQEGGYLLSSLGENVVSFIRGLLGQ